MSRWLRKTSNRVFFVYPLALLVFEYLWRGGHLEFSPWGLPLLGLGYLQFRLAGAYRNRLGGGGPGLRNPPEHLVATGIYAWTRNPMYLGCLFYLAGIAITLRSVAGLLLLVGHVPWFHYRVLKDERRLESLWGNAYIEYKHRVRRWLPGFL